MPTHEKTRNFCGKWISNADFAARRPISPFKSSHGAVDETIPQNQHILFRKTFAVDSFQTAEIFISADDYYKLYINGLPVSMGPAPGYPGHYYYDRVDVRDYLMTGENTIAVHTYYQGLVNRVWVSGDGRHGLVLDLVLDGKVAVCSDEHFRTHLHTGYTSPGKCGYDTQFLENYDSRADEVEFAIPYFDDSDWDAAQICRFDDHVLFESPIPQLITESVKPASIRRTPDGILLDFGACYVGYLYVAAEGSDGDVITVRCGQELDENGRVRYEMRANCTYSEEWTLSGMEDDLNWFDYKSFRYAELILPKDAQIKIREARLLARHYPFTLKARPNTEDERLLKVWDLCVRSLKYGVQETVMDCMEREKGQYVGDGVYTSATLAVLTGDTAMMEKLIDNGFQSAFLEEGLLSCTTCSFVQEIAEYPLMLPWLFLIHAHLTGDTAFISRRYDRLIQLLETYRTRYEKKEPGLLYDLDRWCVVDWPDRSRDGYDCEILHDGVTPGTHNVISAYYIGAVKTVNRIAGLIGRPPYRDTEEMAQNFRRAFYDETAHLFRDRPDSVHISLPGNVLPLLFDLCPDAQCEAHILTLIRERRLKTINIFMTLPLLAAVKRKGEEALLQELLRDENAWLRMIDEGATATFEAFGKGEKWNTSLFHLAFTYAALFLTDWGMENL